MRGMFNGARFDYQRVDRKENDFLMNDQRFAWIWVSEMDGISQVFPTAK